MERITPSAPNGAHQLSYLDYRDYRDGLKSISGLALHREDVFSVGEAANAQPVWGELVTGNYFAVLGVTGLGPAVYQPGRRRRDWAPIRWLLSGYKFWQRHFHADPHAIGKLFPREFIIFDPGGVAPPEFRGVMPRTGLQHRVPADNGRELSMLDTGAFRSRGNHAFYAVTRLKPGFTIAQAAAETGTFAASLASLYPRTNRGVSATILPAWRFHSAAPERLLGPLKILMAISILVLLIVCANVANLLLSRAVTRQRELSIRAALSAGGTRLTRQLLSETLLLAIGGTLAGLPMAITMGDLLPALVPLSNSPVAIGFQISGRVVVFAVVACVVCTLIAGSAPLLFWLRADLNDALKEGGRGGGSNARSHRMRAVLVVAEVALASVALIGAGLFLRSFQHARSIDPGFDKDHVAMARFYLSTTGFDTGTCWIFAAASETT